MKLTQEITDKIQELMNFTLRLNGDNKLVGW